MSDDHCKLCGTEVTLEITPTGYCNECAQTLLGEGREVIAVQKKAIESLSTALAFREHIKALPPIEGGRPDDMVLRLFAATTEQSDWWVVLHRLLDSQHAVELGAALGPGLSDADRHYCAGRAACLGDFAEMLLKSWMQLAAARNPQ